MKRILFSFSIITVFLSAFIMPVSVFAQAQINPYSVPNIDNNVPQNLHTGIQSIMIETMSAMICQLIGIDPTNIKQPCLDINSLTGKIGFAQADKGSQRINGAIGFLADNINTLYILPVRTSTYISYITNSFGFAPKVHAAGPCTWSIGFCGLSPLIRIWSTLRDIVYFLFVFVFAVVGLAIMLRIRIDPRTVMTIENQIPKIVIALILVTFSFAIAGFLVDIMYIVCGLLFNIVHPFIGNISLNNAQGRTVFDFTNDTFGGFIQLAWPAANALGDIIGRLLGFWGNVINFTIAGFLTFLAAQNIFAYLAQAIGSILRIAATPAGLGATIQPGEIVRAAIGVGLTAFATALGANLWKIIILLIILIGLLVSLFRLFFNLLLSYFFFLLDVVLAPFWIIIGVLPGTSLGFTAWLRSIVSNLIVFPATIAIFLLGKIFIDAVGPGSLFFPPLIGNPVDTAAAQSLLALATVYVASQMRGIVTEALKPPQSRAIGAGVAHGFGGGARAVGAIGGGLFGSLFGQEIRYDASGRIVPIENPLARLGHRLVRRFGG